MKCAATFIVALSMLFTAAVASATGIDTNLHCDDCANTFPIGFTFTYWGADYTTIGISSNGWVRMNGADSTYSNPDFPMGGNIAAFFDDLRSDAAGSVIYYQTLGTAPNRQLVVQYHDVTFYGSNLPMGTFEIIFYETTNQIKFQYRYLRDSRSFGNDATIGIDDPATANYIRYSYLTSSLQQQQAILFTPNGAGGYTMDANASFSWIDLSGLTSDAPQDGGDFAGSAIHFTWNAMVGANAYQLQLATANDGTGIVNTVTLGNVTTYDYSTASLTRGATYYARVAASVNGGSTWQNPSSFSDGIMVDLEPGPPTDVTAVPDNAGGVAVSFTPPAPTGGSPITGYTVIADPAGGTDLDAGSAATTHTVTGLALGMPYTFTVTATNGGGTGVPSSPSASVIPRTVPGAPGEVVATPGNGQATVSFSAPPSNGGNAISGYTVVSSPAGGIDLDAGTIGTTHTVVGLVNGTSYTFTVRAANIAGTGDPSSPSAAVVPRTVPGSPLGLSVEAGDTQATVTFSPPDSDGGSPVTGYTVISTPAGGVDQNGGTTGLSHLVTGLTNGIPYTFRVTATNIVGTGSPSAASASVIPSPPIPGLCGSANNQTFTTAPAGAALCLSGNVDNFTGAGPWSWVCRGVNGGSDSPVCNAAIREYTLSFVADLHGALAGTISQVIKHGASSTPVTALPATGYHLVNWTGDNGFVPTSANPLTVTNVTASQTITAHFSDTYAITLAPGSGGTITPGGVQNLLPGATATFTITPGPNRHIVSASGCGGSYNPAAGIFTIAPVVSDCTVTATFAIDTFTISVVPVSNGSLNCPVEVTYGSPATCSIHPAQGYHLGSLVDGGLNVLALVNGSNYIINAVTTNHTITPRFDPTSYLVTSTAGAGGLITPAGLHAFGYNQTPSFAITPNPGYQLVTPVGGSCGGTLSGAAPPFTYLANAITTDCTVTASFSLIPHTIVVTAPVGGEGWRPGTSHPVSWTSSNVTNVLLEYKESSAASWTTIGTAAAAAGSYTWPIPAGTVCRQCRLRISDADNAAYSGTSPLFDIAPDLFTVTPVAGSGGTMNPPGFQPVQLNDRAVFTVNLLDGYSVDTVTGCGGGLSGTTYTTGPIADDCTVTATFKDTTPPGVAIYAPVNNSRADRVYQVNGVASDTGSGVKRVEFAMSGSGGYLQANGSFAPASAWLIAEGTTSWKLVLDNSGIPDGAYTIAARSVDMADNTSPISTITFTKAAAVDQAYTRLDLNLSSQTILTGGTLSAAGKLTRLPVDGSRLNGRTITLTVTPPTGDPVTVAVTTSTDLGHYSTGELDLFPVKGTYRIQASFAGEPLLAQSSSDPKSVLVGSSAGYAVIVTGKLPGNDGLASHNKTANRIYKALKKRGFVDENITYLSYQSADEATAAGVAVDARPTRAVLQQALTQWAAGRINGSPAPFYLLMVDHGSPDTFYLDTETVSPADLNGWLAELENGLIETAREEKRVVVIGSCYSGTYIPVVSRAGRIVITSASADEESYKGPNEPDGVRSGEFFLEAFFSGLLRGSNFKDSFDAAADKTHILTRKGRKGTPADLPLQHPLLDDDGNGSGSRSPLPATGDGTAAVAFYLGTGVSYNTNSALNPAELTKVSDTINLGALTQSATLWATANFDNEVSSAWVEIRPPSFLLARLGRSEQPDIAIPAHPMIFNSGNGRWEYTHSDFTEEGIYEAYYYVKDRETGAISPLQRSLVYKDRSGNQPPDPFSLVAPADVSEQPTSLTFTWNETTDPDSDPVTYILFISRDQTFATIDVRREELRSGLTVIGPEAGLLDLTTYYWKVQAVDSFFAVRESAVRSFTTNSGGSLSVILAGKVTSGSGGPGIAGATVTAGIASVTTLADGTFAMPLPAGQTTVTSTAAGYYPSGDLPIPGGNAPVKTVAISLTPIPPVTHLVTTDMGANGGITPTGPVTVNHGATTSFTFLPAAGYQVATATGCDGSLSGTIFTTGPVTGDCTISATFAVEELVVAGVVAQGSGGISCQSPVTYGGSSLCSIFPSEGFRLSYLTDNWFNVLSLATDSGYTINGISAGHTVRAYFTRKTYLVTQAGASHGVIVPSQPQSVNHGSAASFLLAPEPGYRIARVEGTCGGATVEGIFTTSPVTADCTVIPVFEPVPGTIVVTSPNGGQSWQPGAVRPISWVSGFAGTVQIDYRCDSGAGWIPVGTAQASAGAFNWTVPQADSTACRVRVSATPGGTPSDESDAPFTINGNIFTVTPTAGAGGSIAPDTLQGVIYDGTTSFTLAPLPGYAIDSVTGCGGNLAGWTYTTGGIRSDCTVAATFRDVTSPTVTIEAPAPASQLEQINRVSGTAADTGSGLARVEVQVGDGTYFLTSAGRMALGAGWVTAAGTSNWELPIIDGNLGAGTYTIRARAIDQAGNSSYQAAVSVTKIVQRQAAYTELTLDLSTQAMLQGATLSASGKLSRLPDDGSRLRGLTLTLTLTPPQGAARTVTATTYDDMGHYIVPAIDGFTQGGLYRIAASFAGTTLFAASDSPTRQLLVGASAGYAVLVQGKIPGDEGIASHNKTANRIYQTLKKRGLTDDTITYLNYDTTQSGVDSIPTKEAVRTAITGWAMTKLNDSAAPFYLIMVDHGSPGAIFHLGDETITAVDLSSWLGTLEAGLSADALKEKRVIVIGSCFSGSFIPALSASGRVVIASASAGEESYKGPNEPDSIRSGEYFLDAFFTHLGRGASLTDAFVDATRQTRTFTRRGGSAGRSFDGAVQHPLLDDDGNHSGSTLISTLDGDGLASAGLYLGVGTSYDAASSGQADVTGLTPTRFLDAGSSSATLWASSNNDGRVSSAWIEIRPPSLVLTPGASTTQVDLTLVRHFLTYNPVTSRWEYPATDLTEEGTYEIFYYVKDFFTHDVSPMKRSVVYHNRAGNQPPAGFALISPVDGTEESTSVILSWEPASDPDGDAVTYTVMLSSDASFTDPAAITSIEGIRTTTIGVGADYGLKDGVTYSWKVLAIDAYGAVRESSRSFSFTTNNTNADLVILQGSVVDAATSQAVRAQVLLNTGRLAVAGVDGSYYLNLGRTGAFTVTVSADGYQSVVKELAVTSQGASTRYTQNFSLAPAVSQVHYTITTQSSAGGTITCLSTSVAEGANTSCTLTPDAGNGYRVDTASGCGGTLSGIAYTTAALSSDCTITASFVQNSHTVTPQIVAGQGSLDPGAATIVLRGSTWNITATSGANYHVAAITGCNGAPYANSANAVASATYTTGAVTGNCTVAATFAINRHGVAFTTDGHGTIDGSASQSVDHGASAAAVTAIPATGYHFVNWTGDNGFVATTANPLTVANITGALNIRANFAINSYLVTPIVAAGGDISPAIPQSVDYNGTVPFVITPPAGFDIVLPVGGSCPQGALNGAVYTTGAIVADCSVEVAFVANYTATLTVSVNGAGSVHSVPAGIACDSSGGTCSANFAGHTLVSLVASSSTSGIFSGWGGACSGASPACTIFLTGNSTATATFTAPTQPPVRIPGPTTVHFASLGAAYSALTESGTIQAMARSFTEDLLLAKELELVLSGGFDATFGASGGFTVVQGSVIIGRGSLVVDSIIIAGDYTEPDVAITAGPADPDSNASGSISFTSLDATAGFECLLDSGSFAPCTSPFGYAGLADGSHTFRVRAKDPAGNLSVSTASWTWTIDTVAPGVTITGWPDNPDTRTSASFTFSSPDPAATFQCRLDTVTFTPCTSPYAYANLGVGSHTFAVRARDVAGNTTPVPATWTWTVQSALSVSLSGSGSGTVNSVPAGIACPGACSASFAPDMPTVLLTAFPEASTSTFGGWSGDCSGTDGASCTVTMNGRKTVTATFSESSPVMGEATPYSKLRDAFRLMPAGGMVRALAQEFNEDVLLDRGLSFVLKGGYDGGYMGNTGWTAIRGTVTIETGVLTVEKVEIR